MTFFCDILCRKGQGKTRDTGKQGLDIDSTLIGKGQQGKGIKIEFRTETQQVDRFFFEFRTRKNISDKKSGSSMGLIIQGV